MALQIQGERQKAEEVIGGTRHPARQVPSRPPFIFVHFPTNWDFDPATGGFVPGVRTVGIVAGAGGVRSNGDASTKLGYLRRKGAIVIDPTDTRLGDYRLYGTKIKNDRGRDVNMSIFERYERVGNRSFHDHDINEFRKFQSVLVDTGVIPAMHDRVKSLEIDKARAAAAKMEELYGSSPTEPVARERVLKTSAMLLAMEQGIPLDDARKRITEPTPSVAPTLSKGKSRK